MVADQSPSITAVSWVFGGLSVLMVGVRLYTRVLVTRQRGWDDFWIALALANALVCSALVEVGIHYGLGRHTNDIPDAEDRIQAAKYTVIAPNFSIASTTTGKLSVAVFLLRLMGPSATTAQRWSLYILTVISIILNTLAVIAVAGFCRPAEKIWRPSVHGSCFPPMYQLILGTTQAAFNGVADLFLAIFPIWIFYKVQLVLAKKIGILVILGAGIFAAAATFVKCVLLKNLPEHADITWSWAPITTWYTIEMYVIIMCVTLPTLPQAYTSILRKRSTYYNTSHERSAKSGGSKNTPIRLQRIDPDASLFETVAEPRRSQNSGSSRENILHHKKLDIKKTTEVRVTQERRRADGDQEGDRYFPRQNPFRSKGVDSGFRGSP
ncbi:hypothetical protein BJX68DRAFT_264070 [Aspergillus pseudodeflectus]|uniref:Rhodopsin domain-containing protein n=1 Tax=Aspergillus pseudodeflectus TaxID=176178 RepID=A0ABR4KTY3_9EURO